MKLERFDKHKNVRNITIVSFIFLIGLIAGVMLFNSFAYFEETKSFNIIEGKVPTINKGDVKIAVKVDGSSASEFPSKENHKYVEDPNTCTNGANITWDSENWKFDLSFDKPTVCTLKFVSIKYQYTLDGGDPTDELPVKKGH